MQLTFRRSLKGRHVKAIHIRRDVPLSYSGKAAITSAVRLTDGGLSYFGSYREQATAQNSFSRQLRELSTE